MMKRDRTSTGFPEFRLFSVVVFLCAIFVAAGMVMPRPAIAASAAEIDRAVDEGLVKLYASSPAAKELSKVALGILVFPDVVKGGFIVGGEYGTGALRVGGTTVGYYNTVAGSYGLQAGAQKFGFAMFFMTKSALDYLSKSAGWEIGVGPNVVVVDAGLSKSLTTSTAKEDIYAFGFNQRGLFGGLGLEGSKITKITPDK